MANLVYTILQSHHLYADYPVEFIKKMAQDYSEESGFPHDFDEVAVEASLVSLVSSEDALVFVFGDYEGFAIVQMSYLFSFKPIANLSIFYIKPKHRSSSKARLFLKCILAEISSFEPHSIVSNSVSMIDSRSSEAYGAILKRLGWQKIEHSQVYLKEFDDG